MSLNHVVAWIDHAEAHIIHFNPEAPESEAVKIASSYTHGHNKAGVDKAVNPGDAVHYFDAVADAVKDAGAILVVGPGMEKLALMKHLIKNQHLVAEKVFSVETVDHPNDAQLQAYARKYFDKNAK